MIFLVSVSQCLVYVATYNQDIGFIVTVGIVSDSRLAF